MMSLAKFGSEYLRDTQSPLSFLRNRGNNNRKFYFLNELGLDITYQKRLTKEGKNCALSFESL